MIFYLANGHTLCGTQADARAIDKNFKQIDIPTDKAGLMAFVQELYNQIGRPQAPAEAALAVAATPPPELSRSGTSDAETPVLTPDFPEREVFDAGVLQNQIELLSERPEAGFDAIESHQSLFGVTIGFSRGVHMLNIIAAGEHQLARVFRQRRKGRS